MLLSHSKKISLLTLLISSRLSFCAHDISPHEQALINHVKFSIEQAQQGQAKLSNEVLAVKGMTSPKVKRLLNNLCSLPETTYFEVGVWKGSTFTAALYNNQESVVQAVAIDNWSEFGGPFAEFKQNCKTFINKVNYQFYEHDSFTINKENLFDAPVNIYFYDGSHIESAQEQAFTYFDSLFAPTFIALVDDWNHKPVPKGTKKAFQKLGYTILFEQELPSRSNGDTAQWWNGLYIAVIRRNTK
jgi:hypothetical protein